MEKVHNIIHILHAWQNTNKENRIANDAKWLAGMLSKIGYLVAINQVDDTLSVSGVISELLEASNAVNGDLSVIYIGDRIIDMVDESIKAMGIHRTSPRRLIKDLPLSALAILTLDEVATLLAWTSTAVDQSDTDCEGCPNRPECNAQYDAPMEKLLPLSKPLTEQRCTTQSLS